MRILGLAGDTTGCGYYRIQLPLAALAAGGHVTSTTRTWDMEADVDVVVGQRLGKRGEYERCLQVSQYARLVYEIDDDLWNVHPTNVAAYPSLSDPDTRRNMARCVAVADCVTVSTEPLARVVGDFNTNVVVLPNRIDQGLLSIDRPRREKVTVGWSGGNSHVLDLRMIAPRLRRFLERNPAVDMHFIGNDYSMLLKRECRITPFCDDVWGYYRNIDFDIALAPLEANVFNRSKSHIRALEHAALGIPVLASDSAAYDGMVIDGVTGFLIRRDHEWESRLRDLVNDEAMRTEMGVKAREHARAWTMQAGVGDWENTYAGLL